MADEEDLDYERAEAWKLLSACPNYYCDNEETPKYRCITMNDVWGWACSDGIDLTDDNVVRIAELYNRYGFGGFLYYQVEIGEWSGSEFTDNNRFIQFVAQEETVRRLVPDSNKRAYHKTEYTIDGKIG
jgi:hypothetical protein